MCKSCQKSNKKHLIDSNKFAKDINCFVISSQKELAIDNEISIENSNYNNNIIVKKLIDKANELIEKSNIIFLVKIENESTIENIYIIKLYELLFELYIKDSNYKDALYIAKKFIINIYKYYKYQ
jgi:hypothetical protein